MAATLTADHELTFFSFPIDKSKTEETAEVNPVDGTPDLIVWGKASDGSLDGDLQVVDPSWSAKAIQDWYDTGANVRVQHQAQRDPAGRGIQVDATPDGTWVKTLVAEPRAKHLVRIGALNDYSIGISHPEILRRHPVLDPEGKAVNGIITGRKDGLTRVSEISLVDRGSNYNTKFAVVKAAADGSCEYVGKVFGADDLLTKAAHGDPAPEDDSDGHVTVNIPKSATVTFSPSDLAKLLKHREVAEEREDTALKAIAAAESAVTKRDIDAATRRRLASQGRALSDGSYPIETREDAGNAVTLALSGHGDVTAAKALIRRVARKEGWQDILDRLDSSPAKPGKKKKVKVKSAPGLVASDYVFPETRSFPVMVPEDVPAVVKAWDEGAYAGTRTADELKVYLTRLAIRKGDEFARALPAEWKPKAQIRREAAAQRGPVININVTGDVTSPAELAKAIQDGLQPRLDAGEVTKADDDDEGASDTGDPALHHQDGDDDDTDSDADAMDKAAVAALCTRYGWTAEQVKALPAEVLAALVTAEKTAAPDMTKPPKVKCPACGAKAKTTAKFCPSCGKPMAAGADKTVKPTPGEGVTGAAEQDIEPAPEHREPDGPAIEALEHDAHLPTVPDSAVMQAKTAALHRSLGVPFDAGWLHDLLCPAFDPATAKAAHPYADLSMIDDTAWQAKALEMAAAAPLDDARSAALMWQNALAVKQMPADLADEIRTEAHKAFRDANPGPGSAPVPGEIVASRFSRPYITEGHAAPSPGHDAPHTAPIHPGHISASDFQRGFIQDGHAADSPGNPSPRPEPVPAPEVPGVPSRVYYTRMQRDNARQAMTAMHDHIARTFPDVCPMHGPGHMGEPGAGARPVPAGVGGPVPHSGASTKTAAATADGATPDGSDGQEALIARAARLERKLRRARKAAGLEAEITGEIRQLEPMAIKAAAGPLHATVDPDLIKAAVTEATSSLVADFTAAIAQRDEDHQAELRKVRKELKELHKVADAIADQPDLAVTAYRSVALAGVPKTSASPAGVPTVAKRAEHAQAEVFNAMVDTWRNDPDPGRREEAYQVLRQMTGLNPGNPMT